MHKQAGFSLIELLVVLLIIGLGIGFVSLSIGNNEQQLRLEAKQFANMTSMVAGEAILGREQLGVDIFRMLSDDGQLESSVIYGYRWLQRVKTEPDENSTSEDSLNEYSADEEQERPEWIWLPIALAEIEPEYFFSAEVSLQLDMNGAEVFISDKLEPENKQQREELRPDIYLFASGEMTPFELKMISGPDETVRHRIEGDLLGRLVLDKVDDEY